MKRAVAHGGVGSAGHKNRLGEEGPKESGNSLWGQVVLSLFKASWWVREIAMGRTENEKQQSHRIFQVWERRSLFSKPREAFKGSADYAGAILNARR